MRPGSDRIAYTVALVICGFGLVYLFHLISLECPKFEQGTSHLKRPIVTVVTHFLMAFAVYILAWLTVGGWSKRRGLVYNKWTWIDLAIVFAFGIAFRFTMTPTAPIQEIDLYRYVWDGAVFSNGMDPYFYGPQNVFNAANGLESSADQQKIQPYVELVKKRPGLQGVLSTIHYGNYTSPYPPVSQFFFGLSIATVPKGANAAAYILAMKCMLVIFDVGSAIVLSFILIHLKMNPSLMLTYFWCPLILKEIANGGHLDSIATFFTVLTVYFATKSIWKPTSQQSPADDENADSSMPENSFQFASLSAVALAAAFAAKVFPLFIFPIWFVVMLRTGWRSLVVVFIFGISAYLFMSPMLKHLEIAERFNLVSEETLEEVKDADPNGIEAFSKFWEMNDFLFMMVVENLKPDAGPGQEPNLSRTPWFRVTSNEFREKTIESVKEIFDGGDDVQPKVEYRPSNYAFFITRYVSLAAFGCLVLWACISLLMQKEALRWLEMVFLILAWFWLLSPTQNPWYWTWSMPFLIFATGRTWMLLSGLLFGYYLRFWFEYQYADVGVMAKWKSEIGDAWYFDFLFPWSDKFPYQGNTFFDFYGPVLEFGPWLVLLTLMFAIRIVRQKRQSVEIGL